MPLPIEQPQPRTPHPPEIPNGSNPHLGIQKERPTGNPFSLPAEVTIILIPLSPPLQPLPRHQNPSSKPETPLPLICSFLFMALLPLTHKPMFKIKQLTRKPVYLKSSGNLHINSTILENNKSVQFPPSNCYTITVTCFC
jgi:hypothetical protein